MKLKRILFVPILVMMILVIGMIAAYAVTPNYVCSSCGASLTYETDGDDNFTITHPSGGNCAYSGKTVKTIPSWAKFQSSSGTGDGSGTSGDGTDASTEEDYGIAGFMLDTVFGSSDSNSDSLVGDLANPLQMLADSFDDIIATMDEFVEQPFYYAVQAIAITLTLFYFMTGLITRDLSQNFGKPTLEMIARPFGRVIVVIVFIMNCWMLCQFFLTLSQFALSQVASLANTESSSVILDIKNVVMTACGWKSVKDANVLDKIFNSMGNIGVTIQVVIAFLVPFVVTIFCNVAAVWVVLSRTINIVIYSVLGPLALSDLYGEQHFKDTRAFGWIKKYFALGMQSTVIVLAYYVTNQICGQILTQIFANASTAGSSLTFGQIVNFASYVAVLKVVQIGAVITSLHKVQEIIA